MSLKLGGEGLLDVGRAVEVFLVLNSNYYYILKGGLNIFYVLEGS